MSKYEIVKEFYKAKLWSLGMVWNAVGRWITEKEYLDITGKKYEKE
ncbi:MAG: XkdX family protein [Lacrimispora sphenoides]